MGLKFIDHHFYLHLRLERGNGGKGDDAFLCTRKFLLVNGLFSSSQRHKPAPLACPLLLHTLASLNNRLHEQPPTTMHSSTPQWQFCAPQWDRCSVIGIQAKPHGYIGTFG